MKTLTQKLAFLSFFALLFSCHLTKEEGDVFSFPSLVDSLAGADHATILLKDESGRVIDTLFHGPVDSTTRFRKLDAPHYEGGKVVLSIEGRKDGVVIFREDRTYSDKDGKIISSRPFILPGSTLRIKSNPPQLIAGDSLPLPSVEILPVNLPGAVEWISRLPASFSAGASHLRAHAEGSGYLVARLVGDTAKRDSLWVQVAGAIDPRPELDSLSLSPDTLIATVRGPTARFTVRFKPDTLLPSLDWRVEDSTLASIAVGGSITAKSPGQTRVVATSRTRPPRSDTAVIRILPAVKVDSVRFSLESLNLFAQGAAESLVVTVHPKEANPEIVLTVADPSLASLEGRRIRGLKDGETWIFARSKEDPDQWDSIRVMIRPLERVQRVTVQPGSLALFFKGEPGQLTAILAPASLSPRFLWRSTVPEVAAVDGSGKITPIAPGMGFIVVMAAADTLQRDSALISVKKDVPRLSVGRDTVIAVGRTVTFSLSVTQDYGSVVMHKWDLDGNGVYDDSSTALRTNLSQTYGEAKEYLARFYVRDSEGNDTVTTRKITAVNGPVIQFHSPANGAYVNKSPVEVTWSVDGVRQTGSEPLVEGANTLTRNAKDAAGNTYSATLTLHLDTEAPMVAISQPLSYTLTRLTHLPVAWTVDGRPQTTRITESLGGRQGSISIIREWTDSAGNRGADTVVITRDTVAPAAVAFVNPTSPTIVNASHSAPVQWAWTRTGEPADSFLVSLNGAPAVRQAGTSYILPSVSNQTYVLQVQQIDAAGNVSPSASHSVTVDKSPPPAPVVSGTTPTGSPTWNWSAGAGSDGARVYRYRLATNATYSQEGTATSYSPVGLPSGSHTLFVQERDGAGNWSTDGAFSILVDRAGPTLTISSPTEMGRVVNFNPQVSGTVEDMHGVKRVEYRLNSGGYVTAVRVGGSWSFSISYDIGANSVWIRSEDDFGNRDSISVRIFKYPNIIFVRKGASGTGKSWDDAIGELHVALDSSRVYPVGTEVWVAQGRYVGSVGEPDFLPIRHSNLRVVGGFFADKPSTDSTQRSLTIGSTIIEPYFGTSPSLQAHGFDRFTLDGFTLVKGISTPSQSTRIHFKNIRLDRIFQDGGGIVSTSGESTVFENCDFTNLSAKEGAVFYFGGYNEIYNCRFISNKSEFWTSPVEIGSSAKVYVRGSYFEDSRGQSGKLYHFDFWNGGPKLDIDESKIQGGKAAIFLAPDAPEGTVTYGSGNTAF